MIRLFGLTVAISLLSVAAARADLIHYTGHEVNYTAPTTGTYTIIAYGGQGGGGGLSYSGGLGAELGGSIQLTAGDILQIYVGGQGETSRGAGGGGGGGTFIYEGLLLLAAGGGGGAGSEGNGLSANNGPTGRDGIDGNSLVTNHNGKGGSAGNGGSAGSVQTINFGEYGGAGGAGVFSSGQGSNFFDPPLGGAGPLSFAGGAGARGSGSGGYGGGGGSDAGGGGGGGGYAGGGGGGDGFGAGGGGNYFNGTFLTDPVEGHAPGGDGFVDIEAPPSPVPAPEPSSLALLVAAGLGLSSYAWRRRRPAIHCPQQSVE